MTLLFVRFTGGRFVSVGPRSMEATDRDGHGDAVRSGGAPGTLASSKKVNFPGSQIKCPDGTALPDLSIDQNRAFAMARALESAEFAAPRAELNAIQALLASGDSSKIKAAKARMDAVYCSPPMRRLLAPAARP